VLGFYLVLFVHDLPIGAALRVRGFTEARVH
jgi:hypothetical protein